MLLRNYVTLRDIISYYAGTNTTKVMDIYNILTVTAVNNPKILVKLMWIIPLEDPHVQYPEKTLFHKKKVKCTSHQNSLYPTTVDHILNFQIIKKQTL